MRYSIIKLKYLITIIPVALTLFLINSCATEDNTSDTSSIFKGLASSGVDILVDGIGNPVVTGFGYGDVSTDSGSSEADIFLSRHSVASGATLSFAQEDSTGDEDFAQAVVELGGNFYVAGHTYGDLSSDAGFGGTDIFLMQFNSAGVKQWTRQYGTSENDFCWDITTVGGNLFLVGNTEGVFPGVSGKTNDQGNDIILVKLDSSGNQLGVVQIGEDTAINSNTYSQSYGVTVGVDTGNNIIIGGITNDTLGASKIGGNDIVLAKYDSATLSPVAPFNIKQLGTTYDDSITNLITSGTDIYFTGFTYGTPQTGYYDSTADYSEDHSYTEVFLYKYDSNGDQVWVRQNGTATYDRGYALALDGSGNVLVAGNTNGDLNGTNAGSYDFFILSYTTGGSLNWTFQYGSDVYDTVHGIAYDTVNDNLFVTGKTYGELNSQSNSSSSFSAFITQYDTTPDTHDWTVVF